MNRTTIVILGSSAAIFAAPPLVAYSAAWAVTNGHAPAVAGLLGLVISLVGAIVLRALRAWQFRGLERELAATERDAASAPIEPAHRGAPDGVWRPDPLVIGRRARCASRDGWIMWCKDETPDHGVGWYVLREDPDDGRGADGPEWGEAGRRAAEAAVDRFMGKHALQWDASGNDPAFQDAVAGDMSAHVSDSGWCVRDSEGEIAKGSETGAAGRRAAEAAIASRGAKN